MKKNLKTLIALLLVLTMGIQAPARAFAGSQTPAGPDYINEVKIAMGSKAESALEGYTILSDEKGKAVDLNEDAGGDWGSQGDRRVILGYKTTKEQSEAITDLAVMNMKGGYDVQEYEALIQQRMDSQIIPLIRKFQSTIDEYRENLNSDDDVNRARAEYCRAALNKLTDDDCDGAGLGDLLLNETRFEMGDKAYDALPEEKKKQHCDIVTLFMQADGQLMLMICALLTKAADTAEDSWIERLSGMTYDDLLASYDMPETEAKQQMARDFEDDARQILASWDKFREEMLKADQYEEELNKMTVPNTEALRDYMEGLGDEPETDDLVVAYNIVAASQVQEGEMNDRLTAVMLAGYLKSIEYGEGTLYDFFTKSSSDLENDLSGLFPMAASLSGGQRAGLEFVSLRELVMAGSRDVEYDLKDLEGIPETSVFEGVDRGIYEKGGVAMTWAAKRAEALEAEKNLAERSMLSTRTVVLWTLTAAAMAGCVTSLIASGLRPSTNINIWNFTDNVKLRCANMIEANDILKDVINKYSGAGEAAKSSARISPEMVSNITPQQFEKLKKVSEEMDAEYLWEMVSENDTPEKLKEARSAVAQAAAGSRTAAWMAAGFAAAMLVLAGVSVYLTWEDMKDYYKVDFSPIPHYMVDETAITYYNAKGQKLVKENHAAYYKAAACANRTDDKYVKVLGDCADLNGDVGQQWLALYACRDNKVTQPILADSLKAVVGSSKIPAGYETGIHMFGSASAFNLNNKLYDWNQDAKSIYVYFQIDKEAPISPSTSGSAFTGGWIALTAVLGIGLGAAVTAVSMTTIRKKKSRRE